MSTKVAAGTITNAYGITLSGAAYGVEFTGSPASLRNYGNIAGTAGAGVILQAGGNVSNINGGTITGTTFGVYIGGGSGTVANTGLIAGGSRYGVDLSGGGTVNNSGTSDISGSVGVRGISGSTTVVNYGTITGTGGTAVSLASGFHNRLKLYQGEAFSGIVNGGNGAGKYVSYSTLELAPSTYSTLSGLAACRT